MKKSLGLILVITFIVALMGCSNTTQILSQNPRLNAVISFYDKKKNNSSNLAFIFGDSSQEVCSASNEIIDYKIIFSHEESTSVNNFKIVGEKHIK